MKGLRKIIPLAILFMSFSCQQQKKQGLRILQIGDSNTEIGHITMALKNLLDNESGAEILIVSPFSTNGEESQTILPLYVSKSFPEVAGETNSTSN